jgi:hypothetical protein
MRVIVIVPNRMRSPSMEYDPDSELQPPDPVTRRLSPLKRSDGSLLLAANAVRPSSSTSFQLLDVSGELPDCFTESVAALPGGTGVGVADFDGDDDESTAGLLGPGVQARKAVATRRWKNATDAER